MRWRRRIIEQTSDNEVIASLAKYPQEHTQTERNLCHVHLKSKRQIDSSVATLPQNDGCKTLVHFVIMNTTKLKKPLHKAAAFLMLSIWLSLLVHRFSPVTQKPEAHRFQLFRHILLR